MPWRISGCHSSIHSAIPRSSPAASAETDELEPTASVMKSESVDVFCHKKANRGGGLWRVGEEGVSCTVQGETRIAGAARQLPPRSPAGGALREYRAPESRCRAPTSLQEEQRRDQPGVNIEPLTDKRTQHVVAEGNFRPDWEVRRSRDPLHKSMRAWPSLPPPAFSLPLPPCMCCYLVGVI